MTRFIVAICLALLPVKASEAQTRTTAHQPAESSFKPGSILLGPSTLVGRLGGGDLALGGEFEYGLTQYALVTNRDMGAGTIGISFRVHSYSYRYATFSDFSSSIRITPIAIGANYHLAVPNQKLDPFAGLAIGYATASYSDSEGGNFDVSSGTYLMIDGGARFYFNPRIAVQGGLSVGSRADVGLLRIAAMFRI